MHLLVHRSVIFKIFFLMYFFNSMVTVHIKPTAPHNTAVLTASVKKKNSATLSFTHLISVRLSKDLAKDGTLDKSRRFTLPTLLSLHFCHSFYSSSQPFPDFIPTTSQPLFPYPHKLRSHNSKFHSYNFAIVIPPIFANTFKLKCPLFVM